MGKTLISKIKDFFWILSRAISLSWKASKFHFIMILLLNLLGGLIIPVTTVVWKYFIDEATYAISTGVIHKTVLMLAIFCGIECVGTVLTRLNEYMEEILSGYLNIHVTNQLLDKIKVIEMICFDDSDLYNKIQKVNNESAVRSMNLLKTSAMFLKNITTMGGTLIVLLKFSVPLVFCSVLFCLPILIVSMKIAIKKYSIYNQRLEKLRFVEVLKNMMTINTNIKELKIYNTIDFLKQYILKIYKQYLSDDKKIVRRYGNMTASAEIIDIIAINFFKMIISIKVIINKKTLGDLTLYVNALDNFKSSIINIMGTIASIFENGFYIECLYELLALETGETNKNGIQFDSDFKRIEFKNVWFKYPDAKDYILKDINIVIESKRSYAFVGFNGSGKTTLLKLLLKLYDPQIGEILIDGINIKEIDTRSYYKEVGAVFQDYIKYPLDIKTNIGLGDIEHIEDIKRIQNAAKASGAHDFINKLAENYNTKMQKEWAKSSELSIGQWQKIAISRAFMKDFPIVILDEPTSSLDPKAEYDIYLNFKEMMKGKTCILVAHRFSTVKLADKIYVLNDGIIVEHGNHQELIKNNGLYKQFYLMQADAYLKDDDNGF